ncbi:MAG: 2-amino-4-hydroxy-6-hydroxymethyldihydropteridine diphosphokinase [Proteobacteria bacterium]|nr:2-amino-4-hydroxy-6-hydroxymethyldihydropteridine diphosphokinase [Pseudomonadota bacterium]
MPLQMSCPVRVFIGLGSNLGNREAQIKAALEWLSTHPKIELIRHTELIETDPWGITSQGCFLNSVAEILTELSPHALLGQLQAAEKALGRKVSSQKWGPRVIDLDILLYGDVIVETPDLQVPHAYLTSRPFIIKQILELDSEIVHPRLHEPLRAFIKK